MLYLNQHCQLKKLSHIQYSQLIVLTMRTLNFIKKDIGIIILYIHSTIDKTKPDAIYTINNVSYFYWYIIIIIMAGKNNFTRPSSVNYNLYNPGGLLISLAKTFARTTTK